MLRHGGKLFSLAIFISAFLSTQLALAQEAHEHRAPAKLGEVSFSTSCKPAVQADFNRAVALLHSFTYMPANDAFRDVAQKYAGDVSAEARLVAKIHAGGAGVWGSTAMPPQTQVKDSDAHSIVQWILGGAR